MIIVVEGASSAGKTTWCRRYAPDRTVPEPGPRGHIPMEEIPDRNTQRVAWARFWRAANIDRWRMALEIERRDGLAVCDTDPFKLHYDWSLWRIGEATQEEWEFKKALFREAFASRELGLADLVLCADVDEATLRARRGVDPTRTRRRFELHIRLVRPLRLWYEAIDRLDPGRVVWALPSDGVTPALLARGPRVERSGAALFGQLMHELESS